MYRWNKVLALLMSLMLVIGMCAFAEPAEEEHVHEETPVVAAVEETAEVPVEEETGMEVIEDGIAMLSISTDPEDSEFIDENCCNHIYRNGQPCIVCGKVCEHEWMESDYYYKYNYEDLGEAGHRYCVGEAKYCWDCGYVELPEEPRAVIEEPHVEGYTEFGKCWLCLAENPNFAPVVCAHENAVLDGTYEDWIDDEPIDAYTHKMVWQKYNSYYCEDCGSYFSEPIGCFEEVSEHSFSDMDWSFCNVCDYKCEHPTTVVQDYYETISCESVDETSHSRELQLMHQIRCTVCNRASSVEVGDPIYVLEAHEDRWDEGCCSECGCEMEGGSEYEPCEHSYVDGIGFEWLWGEEIDEYTHKIVKEAYKTQICEKCGNYNWGVWERYEEGDQTIIAEHEYAVDGDGAVFFGVCYDCGYKTACPHDVMESSFVLQHVTVSEMTEDSHTISGLEFEVFTCEDCGLTYETATGKEKTVTEEHVFDVDGKCLMCGYQTCPHTDVTKTTVGENTVYGMDEENKDGQHTYKKYVTEKTVCNECQKDLGAVERLTEEGVEAHAYENGVCSLCGYECTHSEDVEFGVKDNYEKFIPVDDKQHNYQTYGVIQFGCIYCETETEIRDVLEGEELQNHTYENGVCAECGHACSHADKVLGTPVTEPAYEINDATHAATSKTTTPFTCNCCGVEDSIVEYADAEAEKHTYVNGVCDVCGHTCQHSNAADESTTAFNSYADICDATHTVVNDVTTTTTCPDCGNVATVTESVKEEPAAHNYVDGKCQECEHTCAHSGNLNVEEVIFVESVEKKDGKTHILHGDIHQLTVCECCQIAVDDVLVAEDQAVEETHDMSGGKCTVCGYVKPAPTPAPTATPAPVEEEIEIEYTEVPAEEPVHGVTAAEQAPMVETLVNVIESIEAEAADEGKAVEVTIVNAEKVLAEEEHEELVELKAVEQLMVMLQVMGFEAEVEAALVEMELELSEEAVALAEEIAARIAEMDEEELAEFEKLIAELFEAMTETEGEEEEKEIIFQLKIEIDGVETYEAYSFKLVEEQWVLTKISLQAAEEAITEE